MSINNFNRPYVRNQGKGFTPIYMPGERYSVYINFTGIPASDTSSFQLYLIDAWTFAQVEYLGDMTKLFVAGIVGYHLYIENFCFPLVEDNQYFLQVANGTYELCRANMIIVNSKCLDTTSLVDFRHNDQLFGVRYDLIPTFRQKFRLPINEVKAPDVASSREQYRKASGQRELVNSKSFRDIKQTLEMYYANIEDYEALSAMLEHSDVKINGSSLILLDQVKVDQVSDFSEQYKGTFTMIVKELPVEVGFVPDFYFIGGTTLVHTENFLIGNI